MLRNTVAQRTGWLLLGALILAMLAFVACSSDGDDDGDSAASAPSQAPVSAAPTQAPAAAAPAPTQAPAVQAPTMAEPKVKRVIMAIETPGTLSNNARMICCNDHHQLRPMYENLIGVDAETGALYPQLATEWTVEAGGSDVRFKLREGVPFHGDFGEFTGKDVAFSWSNLAKQEDSVHRWRFWNRIVKDVEVVNDHEVIFHMVPDAQFLNGISELYGQILIRSEDFFNRMGEPASLDDLPIAGTGPYQYVTRDVSGNIRFERTEDHWRVTPDFPEFEFRWMNEASTRLAALLTGEIQITKVPNDLIPQAEASGMKRIVNKVSGPRVFGQFYCCFYNSDGSWPRFPENPQLKIKVRQALNKAIDRETIRENLVSHAQPMYNNHYHPTRQAWDPTWETRFPDMYGYDPARARQLLAEEGYGPNNPLEINVLLGNLLQISNAKDVGETIAAYWQDIGVKVKLLSMDPAAERSASRAFKFENHFKLTGTTGDQVHGLFVYNSGLNSPSSTGYYNDEIRRIYREMQPIIDQGKQVPFLRQLGEIYYTEFASVPLWYTPIQSIINPDIVSDYVYPGAVHSVWTHVENIKAAR